MNPSIVEPPPISGAFWSTWIPAWIPNLLMLAATIGYIAVALRRRADAPGGRLGPFVCWLIAMAGLVVAFNSSVSRYSDTLFWVHMVQHLVLIMVVPLFLVWSRVWMLVPAGRGRSVQDVLDGSWIWRTVTSPLFVVPLYGIAVVLTHVTSFQQIALTHPHIRIGENLLYLVAGYLFFAELVRPGESPRNVPHLVRIATVIAAMGADTLAGLVLMLTVHPLAPAYAASHPGWGPSALSDQNTAGAIMWVFGDVVMMAVITVIGVQWGLRADERGAGVWLESIRRREVLGGAVRDTEENTVIDFDQAALDAYNERLALLNRRDIDPSRRRT